MNCIGSTSPLQFVESVIEEIQPLGDLCGSIVSVGSYSTGEIRSLDREKI